MLQITTGIALMRVSFIVSISLLLINRVFRRKCAGGLKVKQISSLFDCVVKTTVISQDEQAE
jgi:hypothetical protein